MAEDKDMFSFWRSYYEAMLLLSDVDAGRLVKAMCRYAFDGEATDLSDSPMLQLAWTMVSGSVRESREKFLRDHANGVKSGEARRARRDAEKDAKGVPKGVPKGDANVSKYVSTYSVGAASLDAQPPAARDGSRAPEPPSFDLTPEEARAEALRLVGGEG